MSSRPRPFKALSTVALAVSLLAIAGTSAAAASTGFGELTRFGAEGTGPGQLSATACDSVGQLEATEKCTTLLGVDPDEENSVFVLDQPKAQEETATELIRHFRIQKFTHNGKGEYEATASVEFSEAGPLNESLEVEEPPVEGIAVDPKNGRLFVLVSDARPEIELKNGEELLAVNYNDWAAGELLAFSTTSKEGTLETEGNAPGSPVLVGEKEFNTLANKKEGNPEATLLSPRGITVDPYKHEVIILAHIRTGSHTEAHAEDESGELPPFKLKGGHDRYVLQRINEETGAFTEKYVEESGVLLDPPTKEAQPDSPVVAGTEAEPHVYVNFEGLVEIPYTFSAAEKAKQVFREDVGYESSFGVPGSFAPGGSMSASEGKIYTEAQIVTGEEAEYGGIDVRSGLSANVGEPLFWTGGQTPTANATTDECVLEPGIPGGTVGILGSPVLVAAGAGGDVFALAPEFLATTAEHPAIVEFGPEGKGCPTGSAKEGIKAYSAAQKQIAEGTELEANTEVTFKVPLTSSDAREVEWKITEGGKTETVTTTPHPVAGKLFEPKGGKQEFEWEFEPILHPREYVEPELKTKVLSKGEEMTVEAVIKSDNGATPEITTQSFVLLRDKPTVVLVYTSPVINEKADEFNASNSKSGSKLPLSEYEWNFGDGTSEKISGAAGAKVTHTFTKTGTFNVTLVVKDSAGDTGEKTVQVKVEPDATEIKEKEEQIAIEEARREKERLEKEDFKLALGASRITMQRSGAISITLLCAGTSSCPGRFSLATSGKVAIPHKHGKSALKLGGASFQIAAHGSKKVTLRLSKSAKLALIHDKSFKVRLSYEGHDELNGPHKGEFKLTLVR